MFSQDYLKIDWPGLAGAAPVRNFFCENCEHCETVKKVKIVKDEIWKYLQDGVHRSYRS